MESVKWVKPTARILRGFRLTTNNRMELLAVIVGLELKNPYKSTCCLIPSMWLIQY
jgi:ribonuclease HI